jgi:hypothetical protein
VSRADPWVCPCLTQAQHPVHPTGTDGAAATETKEVAIKVSTPDLFYEDRKKFKAYCTQVRLYIWADRKRKTKTLKYTVDEVV